MGKSLPEPYRVSLGGLCFDLRSVAHPLHFDEDPSYRQFILAAGAHCDDDVIALEISLADVQPAVGRLLFDGGSWEISARGTERSLVFRKPLVHDPLCEARFRPGSRLVQMTCSPELLVQRDGVYSVANQFRYPLDQVLTMYLLRERGLILHAAGFVVGDRGVVLPGVSGAGKSTITRLASGLRNARALSDDRVILRIEGEDVVVHGTPWPGEAGVAERLHARASHLLFLEKGDHNGVRAITPREALARLLPTASLPWYDAEHLESSLSACDGIIRAVPAGVFTFREESQAIEALETFLASGKTLEQT